MTAKRVRLPGPSPSEGCGSTPLTIEFPAEQPFLATREHARFVEFVEACSHYRYIGVCHGRPGVGKTRSAREFASFPDLQGYGALSAIAPPLADKIMRCRAIFYTVTVSNTPKMIDAVLGTSLTKMGYARLTVSSGSPEDATYEAARRACPLVIVDEADRLTIKSLEHLRDLADRHSFGLILMGMPGLEKRLAVMPSSTRGSASPTSSSRSPKPKCACCSRPMPPTSGSASTPPSSTRSRRRRR